MHLYAREASGLNCAFTKRELRRLNIVSMAAAVVRVRKRKEEKLKEQELKLREKLKEEAKNGPQAAG